ncbi:hypothetical protein [Deinococcus ruber]|uniref:Uncharacterized protein n=1 Tax=Deinococcus ruber TaxID=1848197 RepID=A0A918C985_9DEIO|nr:hypothetical protein [Deinococcus ruber]GGR11194.1 hypothetical protein GCM10008957_24840 [Deinococcus ruber]
MTLKDLKAASEARKEKADSAEPLQARGQQKGAQSTAVKMLGARVPVSVHREFQTQLFKAQEQFPDLTTQRAIPALVRALRKADVWRVFMEELGKD